MCNEESSLSVNGMHDGASPQVFGRARALRRSMTEPEMILWDYLKGKPLGCKFRRQHPINKYVLDFYNHSKRLSIELDGKYHEDRQQKEYDEERTEYLRSVGIKELRIPNRRIYSSLPAVIREIESELKNVDEIG